MSGGFRRALGSLKDTTTVSLARINGVYKELDIAIVKATNHDERPPNEKYVRAIISAVSATRPRADVKYCVQALARRLSKTHNWAVALKSLTVIHRALRDVDYTFHEELINYGKTRSQVLNLSRFKDDSSPEAWDYSAWIQAYALFLEEKLECCCVLKYDVEMDVANTKELDIADLLDQLPILQQLLYRVLCCQPYGTALDNHVIQLALSMVASESIKIYEAICDGVVNLVDKFFEMKRYDAVRALEIYRRSVQQAEKLSEFYEICRSIDVGHGEMFIEVDQPPASFLHAMEDYVKEAPRMSGFQKDQIFDNKIAAQEKVLTIEYRKSPDVEEARPAIASPPQKPKSKVESPVTEPPDLLSLDDPVPSASELEEKNVLPLTIFRASDQTTSVAPVQTSPSTGWELALVAEPSSNANATAVSQLGGGLDKHTLDSLYDDAMKRSNQNVSYSPWQPSPMAGPIMLPTSNDHFYASHGLAAPQYVPMANHLQVSLWQQQQIMMTSQQQQQPAHYFSNSYGAMVQQQQQPSNPFGDSYGASVLSYNANVHGQAYNQNPNTSLL